MGFLLQNFPVEVVPSNFEETLDKAAFSEPWRSGMSWLHSANSPLAGMRRRQLLERQRRWLND